MSAIALLPKTSTLRIVGYTLIVCGGFPAFLSGSAFGQEAAKTPLPSTEARPPEAVKAVPKEPQKSVDPRTLRREEETRRERIEKLSRSQPQIPRESDSLASTGIPKGLLPKRGIKSGRIVYLPSVTVGAVFSDNANSDDNLRDDDVVIGAGATVRAQTLLRRHEFGAEASATAGHSVEGIEDDFFDWSVEADGRFDLDRKNALRGGLNASLAQEADSSAEADDDEDADLSLFGGTLGYFFNGRALDFSLDGFVDREEVSGDSNDDRENTTYTASANLSKKWGNNLSIFLAPAYAITEFDEEVGDDGEGRDSYEITGLVGAEYRPRPRLRVGGSIGYSQAFFDDPNVDDNGSVVGSLDTRLAYNSRTDLALTASREVEVTTVDGSTSEIATTVSATATRLLTSKHAVSTGLTYLHTDFDGLNRVDQDITAGIEYFYRLSDHLVFNLGYRYLERFSNDDNEDFYENQAQIGMTLIY